MTTTTGAKRMAAARRQPAVAQEGDIEAAAEPFGHQAAEHRLARTCGTDDQSAPFGALDSSFDRLTRGFDHAELLAQDAVNREVGLATRRTQFVIAGGQLRRATHGETQGRAIALRDDRNLGAKPQVSAPVGTAAKCPSACWIGSSKHLQILAMSSSIHSMGREPPR